MNDNNAIISEATQEDVDALYQLLTACAHALHQQGMSHWLNVYTVSSVTDNVKQKQVFKLVKDTQIIGCVALSNHPAGYYADCWPNAPQADWYLTQLAVSPAFQSEGWGQFLVQFCIDRVHPKTLQLDAVAHYPALLSFYKKLGFQQISEGIGLGDKRFLFEYTARPH